MLRLETHAPAKALNKAYLKQKPTREQIERFKAQALRLFERAKASEQHRETEENFKTIFADFLKGVWYGERYELNTKGRQDLVIHNGRTAKDPVGVIIEAKRPANKGEMVTLEKPNARALHELLLYYLRERHDVGNAAVKHLVVTDSYAWFVFDGVWWEQHVGRDATLRKTYAAYKAGGHDTRYFYEVIATNFFNALPEPMPVTHFSLNDVRRVIENSDLADDARLIPYYKILAPEHLLSQPFQNDSNSLNREFYNELLHLLGLEEVKDGSKKLIRRPEPARRHAGSFLENTLGILRQQDKLAEVPNPADYGATPDQQLEGIALDLCITWLNRILFLKLLEGQLLGYHRGDAAYAFLNSETLPEFDHVQELFFDVLAREPHERPDPVRIRYARVPYLNSSLFEHTPLERKTIFISSLRDSLTLPVYTQTVLKDESGRRRTGELEPLDYLLRFLNAYDFASDGSAAIQEQNKTLINASVLGLIFEKINGYRDGSFFTPGFITMYMTRQTLRRAVTQRLNERFRTNFPDFDILRDEFNYVNAQHRAIANEVINGLRIVDPAVGSGHFLVSALNELLAIKADLRVLEYRHSPNTLGRRVQGYRFSIENDELLITDEETGQLFDYHLNQQGQPIEALQELQETLFHEKQTLIENCLFGVDINANSVKICRLRLWIELLKSAYYERSPQTPGGGLNDSGKKAPSGGLGASLVLQTLPNIDINIKTGNSLVSRVRLDHAFSTKDQKARRVMADAIERYRLVVQTYKTTRDKAVKRAVEKEISDLKTRLATLSFADDPEQIRLRKLKNELWNLQMDFAGGHEARMEALGAEIAALETAQQARNEGLFRNAFEWRFEFPEVLDEDGNFVGFDVVIGNPPYGVRFDTAQKQYITQNFKAYSDIYTIFIEQGHKILKQKGLLSYIIPISWQTGDGFMSTRKLLTKEANLNIGIVLPYDVFSEAYVDTGIYILEKFYSENHKSFVYEFDPKEKISESILKNLTFNFLYAEEWTRVAGMKLIFNQKAQSLFQSIQKDTIQLQEIADSARGILANDSDYADKQYDGTYLPFFNGKMNRYVCESPSKFVKYGENLREKPKSVTFFEGERILIRRIISRQFRIMATLANDTFVTKKDFYSFKVKDGAFSSKYILAIINSALVSFLKTKGSTAAKKDDFTQLTLSDVRELPIKKIPLPDQQPFIQLVETILAAKKADPSADTSALEAEIDALVYRLYGLTAEEIALVEGRPAEPVAEPAA
jgi:hypothetical protein